jgi:prepilin-type N-terminal cleavage/methylation domain-containing protein
MIKRRAFTLVELLVVIAIIALLVSILMPAMARVKKQARAVMCQTNLRQWRICFQMYEGDNYGYVNSTFLDFSVGKVGLKELWKLKWHPVYNFSLTPPPEEFDKKAPRMKKFKYYE